MPTANNELVPSTASRTQELSEARPDKGLPDNGLRDLSHRSDLADLQQFIDLLDSTWSKHVGNSAVPSENGATLPENALFGRFVLRALVGEGGFGMVFQADDLELKRSVALKLPKPNVLISPDLRARFICEAQSAAALDHENIVRVYQTGEIGSISFIASAYCAGPTLAVWLKDQEGGRAPWRDAADIVRQLAGAVHHAHQRGILHRDVKPSNVLMKPPREPSGDYVPLLTDFGLAKQLAEPINVTRTGAWLGTTRYMSPERLNSGPNDITTSADIYSLGVILYELLTGKPPFDATSDEEVARRIRENEPPTIRGACRDVRRDLETVCLKCLEKLPSRRYGSAQELADDLENCLKGREVAARPLGRGRRLWRRCRRQPLVATLMGLVVLTVAGGAGGVVWQWRSAVRRADQVERSLIEAEHELVNWAWVRDESLHSPNLNDPISIAAHRRLREHFRHLLALHSVTDRSTAFEATARSYEARIAELDNDLDVAADRYRKSIALWRCLVGQDPQDRRWLRALAESLYCYGLLLRSHGTSDDPLFRLNGDDAHFASLLAEDGGAGQVCAEYARLLGEPAEALAQLGNDERAKSTCSASWELWGRLNITYPDVREYKFQNAQAAFLRYVKFDRRNRATRKPETLAVPELMARQLCEAEPENVEYRLLYSQIVRYMAAAARDNDEFPEAIRLYEVAATSLRGMWQSPSPDPAVGNLLASVARNLAALYRQVADGDAAQRATEEAVAVSEACRARNSISRENLAALGFLYKDLAEAYQARGQLADAQRAFNDACRVLRETSGNSVASQLGECQAALSALQRQDSAGPESGR